MLKIVFGSNSKTCHDGNQFIEVKSEDLSEEEATKEEQEEDPLLIKYPVTNIEHEVSCIIEHILC